MKFLDGLLKHLNYYKYHFISEETYGGCTTCNYGGEEVEHIDEKELYKQIDAFIEEFNRTREES